MLPWRKCTNQYCISSKPNIVNCFFFCLIFLSNRTAKKDLIPICSFYYYGHILLKTSENMFCLVQAHFSAIIHYFRLYIEEDFCFCRCDIKGKFCFCRNNIKGIIIFCSIIWEIVVFYDLLSDYWHLFVCTEGIVRSIGSRKPKRNKTNH